MKVNLPSGDSFDYVTKVVKAQGFSSDELFEKRLLLLLPYYLMRYEKLLAQIASDDTRTAELIAECAELRAKLEEVTVVDGEPLLYEELVELILQGRFARIDGMEGGPPCRPSPERTRLELIVPNGPDYHATAPTAPAYRS